MARNVEVKARLDDLEAHVSLAEQLADGPGVTIEQEDVFFNCDSGRLKLRIFAAGDGELIHYHRPDQPGPKTSEYVIAATKDPATTRAVLERAYGVRAVVRKTRRLFMAGRTRIHLDSVDGLGDFLELEVVLDESEEEATGMLEAVKLMSSLGVARDSLVSGAYIDLLEGIATDLGENRLRNSARSASGDA